VSHQAFALKDIINTKANKLFLIMVKVLLW
jgi:hypothetical protein